MPVPLVIKCHDGAYAPYSLLCPHLSSRPKQVWFCMGLAEDDHREVDGDWVCLSCCYELATFGFKAYTHELTPVCFHCVRSLQAYATQLQFLDESEKGETDDSP